LGRKTKKRERSERTTEGPRPAEGGARRFRWLAVAGGLAVCASLAVFIAFLVLNEGSDKSSGPKAAIVDQLSAREPDPAFVKAATATLKQAGYSVDYYPSDEVTVGLYSNLPARDYDIVLLRAHSAVPEKDLALPADVDPAILQRIMDKIGDDVLLFTSETYDENAYIEDQKALRLFPVVYPGDQMSESYFAISSGFVASSMTGRFNGATVILMGCSSLASERTAAALVDRGAAAVVGWSDTVSPAHTDAATERLLQLLLADGEPIAEAVTKTMAELGPDPSYSSVMRSYPSGGG
jgi:hypothetical protein